MLLTYFSFSQNQKETIVFDRKLEEVTISASKTAKSIDKLPCLFLQVLNCFNKIS